MAMVGKDWNGYIELVYDLEEHPPYALGNRFEHVALDVHGDLPEFVENLRAAGVKVLKGPKKAPNGVRWIAFIEDPNGVPIELVEPRER
jgi:catechol 2,3-dioxygenase-like lactoylglutathione lyase family enzyme